MSIYLVVEPLLYIKLFLLLQVYKVDVSDLNKDDLGNILYVLIIIVTGECVV